MPPHVSWILGLPEVERRHLLDEGRICHLRTDERIGHPGMLVPSLTVVLDGAVKEHRTTSAGQDLLTALRGPGDTVLLADTVGQTPTRTAATTLMASAVLVVPVATLMRATSTRPAIGLMLAEALADEARTLQEMVVQTNDDTASRVRRRLLELGERFGSASEDGVVVTLPLTQEELGSWAGASRESTARILQDLRARGLVSTGRRRITLHDPEALARLLERDAYDVHAQLLAALA